MRPATDLDQVDTDNRETLRRHLIAARHAAGLTQRDVANLLNRSVSCVAYTETTTGWRIPHLQRHCRAINTALVLEIHGLPELPKDPLDDVTWSTADMADEYTAQRVVDTIADARVAAGYDLRAMAAKLGAGNDSSVARWELRQGPRGRLSTAQRYARAVGGSLTAALQPAEVRA